MVTVSPAVYVTLSESLALMPATTAEIDSRRPGVRQGAGFDSFNALNRTIQTCDDRWFTRTMITVLRLCLVCA